MKYYIGINGAVNRGTAYSSSTEAIDKAKIKWEEYSEEDTSCTAEVYNEHDDEVWKMNENGEIE